MEDTIEAELSLTTQKMFENNCKAYKKKLKVQVNSEENKRRIKEPGMDTQHIYHADCLLEVSKYRSCAHWPLHQQGAHLSTHERGLRGGRQLVSDETLRTDTDDQDNFALKMDEESLLWVQSTPM